MIDHRPAQTPVRHQGDRPTCVAFATSAAHEWSAGDQIVRSPEDAMWAAHQVGEVEGREETSVAWALEGLARHQHASDAAWPYGQPHWSDGRPAAAQHAANRRALPAWSDLRPATFDEVAAALEAGRPVVLTVRVVPLAWYGGAALIDAEPGAKTPGNHAVLAVGALETPDRLIIKNSWGAEWGDDGYGYLTRRYFEHYALRAHRLEDQ
jgi:hypothetical protein